METIYEIQRIKQIVEEKEFKKYTITSPQDVARIATEWIGDEDREVFLVICLNQKNCVVAIHRCHIGAIGEATVNPREVFKSAILNNSVATIAVSHNHPGVTAHSLPLNPSEADIQVTNRLAKAGETLSIPLLDHIIVGGNPYQFFSFKQEGFLD